jgi:hypothetical protein
MVPVKEDSQEASNQEWLQYPDPNMSLSDPDETFLLKLARVKNGAALLQNAVAVDYEKILRMYTETVVTLRKRWMSNFVEIVARNGTARK